MEEVEGGEAEKTQGRCSKQAECIGGRDRNGKWQSLNGA